MTLPLKLHHILTAILSLEAKANPRITILKDIGTGLVAKKIVTISMSPRQSRSPERNRSPQRNASL